MKQTDPKKNALLSIGALARLSGIPIETLRNWERRYGFPAPERLGSGHRRYAWPVVARLKKIKSALDLGHRPSFAVLANEQELSEVLREGGHGDGQAGPGLRERSAAAAAIEELVGCEKCIAKLDTSDLEQRLRSAWARYGAHDFVTRVAVPFLNAVGDGWESGALTVAHEHFASEVLESFLVGQWRPLAQTARGPRIVLATLDGELHSLGLHMAAVFLALRSFRIVFLGPNTPLDDIVSAATASSALATVIGTSLAADPKRTARRLAALRAELSTPIIVAVGGNDGLPGVDGVVFVETFEAFRVWVDTLAAASGSAS
jgi:MerR family transcriptional regulator, light-induced transcriptional regulator